jgi:uncharacterized protein (DUF2252 family)
MRDPIARLAEYNRRFVGAGRDPAWLRTKLDRLAASPFGFFRGSFHLFVDDWPRLGDDPLAPGDPQPVVGDLHLENFGAFRADDGRFVFDVNDFDETGPGSPAIDLGRLCASFVIADDRHGALRAVGRIEMFLQAYLEAVTRKDLRPIDARTKGLAEPVRQILDEAEAASRTEWLDARVETVAGRRRFRSTEKYQPLADGEQRRQVEEAVREYALRCKVSPPNCPSWPSVLDVAVRIAGTGSLGRWRFAVLMPGKNEQLGKELILELKEAIPSSLTPADTADQATRVVVTQRMLQGDSPAYLGVANVAGQPFTVRELQPTEAKVATAQLSGAALDLLCSACGEVLGRLHRRGGPQLEERLRGRERGLSRRISAFALRYAEVVIGDHELFLHRRGDLEAELQLLNHSG